MTVTRKEFGVLPDGSTVDLLEVTTPGGLKMRVLTWGAIIQSLHVPDRSGAHEDVVLGHDELARYLDASRYFGAVIGRCANRIARGRFALDGVEYGLATNNGANHLHGGVRGFDRRLWSASVSGSGAEPAIELRYTSADGEEGYPGRLEASVIYMLSDEAGLVIDYSAVTDKPTLVNMTQHSYWNLGGPGRSTVMDHELTIGAELFTPVDAGLIPEGAHTPVAGTPFDFRTPTAINLRIASDHEQLARAGGYDHNFVLNAPGPDGMRHAATLRDPESGRAMIVSTTEPGIQFYSGNFLDGSIRGKDGKVYGHRVALCLETQHFPNSPNRPDFPSVVLRPGEEYRSRTAYRFTTDEAASYG